jgi:hypothetical protein
LARLPSATQLKEPGLLLSKIVLKILRFPLEQKRTFMSPHRLTSLFFVLFAALAMGKAAFASPQATTLHVFHSSNLYGEISPCG